jgi:hypothetical protein
MELEDAAFFYRVSLRERTWRDVDDVRDVSGFIDSHLTTTHTLFMLSTFLQG